MPKMRVIPIPMVIPKVKATHLVIQRAMTMMMARLTQKAKSMVRLKRMG
jgi:hypothetical protein